MDGLYKLDVLDHGYVELLDLMGDDHEPVRAARQSYGNADATRSWDPIEKRGSDGHLNRTLTVSQHTSPFEMVELKWRVQCPIFVAREWLRHRTANVNEFSMRYADPRKMGDGELLWHLPDRYRLQSATNHQGSSEEYLDAERTAQYHAAIREYMEGGLYIYDKMVADGVAREQAREHLGLNIYTNFIWKNDLHNTLHFLRLRLAEGAQREFQLYAKALYDIMDYHLPNQMAMWRDTEIVLPAPAADLWRLAVITDRRT